MAYGEETFDVNLLANAVASTGASFIISDHTQEDDPIIFCNDAFEQLTGYRREEIIGRNCRFLQQDDRNQTELRKVCDAVKTGQRCTVTLRNYRKDGRPFLNELDISPLFSRDGRLTHIVGIQRELTTYSSHVKELQNHEWRTPLTILKSTLQLLKTRGLTIDPKIFNKTLSAALKAVDSLDKVGNSVFNNRN